MILDHSYHTCTWHQKHRGDGKEASRSPFLEPHGRVGAEIVCDDTLVQYAAYLALLPSVGGEWMVSFDSDHSGGDGASPFFFSGQFFTILPLFAVVLGSAGKSFFLATLLICGVVDHVP